MALPTVRRLIPLPAGYRTNPIDPDSDADGIQDGTEIMGFRITVAGVSREVRTNPAIADTDRDTFPDGVERTSVPYGGGRVIIDPSRGDTDSDGLADNIEIQTYRTNPSLSDTDKDGVPDRGGSTGLHRYNHGFTTDPDDGPIGP